MNTSSVKLTAFDIVVAQLEAAADQSLHGLVADLKAHAPLVEAYADPSDLVLSVAALQEDHPPTQASFLRLDLNKLVRDWDKITSGISFATKFLEEEHIFDAERLPTSAVVPVLAAMHDFVPDALDSLGNARTLLRKYLWRSFVTQRYENATATRALQDLRGLRAILKGEPEIAVPIFDEAEFPLPTTDELKRAGWPKARDILARGILAVSLRGGAHDIADGTPVSRAYLRVREYHHLFPDSLLTDTGRLQNSDSYRALNCALVTWNTNRNISAKEPIQYLKERVAQSVLGEEEIRSRFATHAVPFETLSKGGYTEIVDGEECAKKIRSDYSGFLEDRATLILEGISQLCAGHSWPR